MKTAKTLRNILENPVVQTCLDKSQSIDSLVRKVGGEWSADLVARRPAPAYRESVDGHMVYKGTDLDLFTVMNALAQREAVINIPRYDSMTITKLRDDQRLVSKTNRHGQVFGTIANANVHSFSTRIKDYNVIQTNQKGKEEVGAFRNFALVDPSGRMYDGWRTIEFKATPEEEQFFEEKNLYTMPETIAIKSFVHPNLAMALFGSRYLETKALANRVSDEAKFYRTLAGILRNAGVNLGGSEKPSVKTFVAEDQDLEKVTVESLEAKLVLPEATGEYPLLGIDKNGKLKHYEAVSSNYTTKQNILRFAEKRANGLSYSVGPRINAPVRAVELAFYLDGFKGGLRESGNEKDPAWGIPDWVRNYREGPKTRIEWNALEIAPKVALLYRIKENLVTVKA